jgi:hypothetical protein
MDHQWIKLEDKNATKEHLRLALRKNAAWGDRRTTIRSGLLAGVPKAQSGGGSERPLRACSTSCLSVGLDVRVPVQYVARVVGGLDLGAPPAFCRSGGG